MSCKHGVETLCATCINDVMCDAIREEGRLAGIREAIVVMCTEADSYPLSQGARHWARQFRKTLEKLLPPPSGGGEKAILAALVALTEKVK